MIHQHHLLPDGAERADFNRHATFELFGTPTTTPDGRHGHIVAVDVRDQFGLGDDVWLIQLTNDRGVVAAVATECHTPDQEDV